MRDKARNQEVFVGVALGPKGAIAARLWRELKAKKGDNAVSEFNSVWKNVGRAMGKMMMREDRFLPLPSATTFEELVQAVKTQFEFLFCQKVDRVETVSDTQAEFIVTDCNLCHLRVSPESGIMLCQEGAGILEEYAKNVKSFKGKTRLDEVECRASGAPYCRFVLTLKKSERPRNT